MHPRKHLGSLEAKLLDASFLSDTISAGTRILQQTVRPYSPSGGLGLQCISALFSPVARLSAVALAQRALLNGPQVLFPPSDGPSAHCLANR
jgi:hypothetical protein